MRPIEKFADIECIYNFADKEEQYTEYVWKLAMFLTPAQEEDEPFECSYAMPIFKQRYNDRLIKMPWTYEEYIANKDIQATISGLGYDIDKFWFALLFIYDYSQGACFNAQEYAASPYSELFHLAKIINENLTNEASPFEENIEFAQNVEMEIKVANKVVHTIKTPNAIKYLADSSYKCSKELEDMVNEGAYNPMHYSQIKEERVFESQNYQIYLFSKLFNHLFLFFGMPQKNVRSRNSAVSYNKTFLISKLIYLTKVSCNEELLYDSSTLKGYISRYRGKGIKFRINNFYK